MIEKPEFATPGRSAPPSPSAGGKRGRVLVVDHDVFLSRVVVGALAGEHEVEITERAATVLARVQAGAVPDAIICDLFMPGMSAMELHGEIAKVDPKAAGRMIFMSGALDAVRAREFLGQVANPRFEKPYDAHALREVVREIVGNASIEEGRQGTGVERRKTPPDGKAPGNSAPGSARKGRVLVVDDDRFMGKAVQRILREAHEIELTESAPNALARLGREPPIDAIVCDMLMPEMTGMDFHREIERKYPALAARVIFVSGSLSATGIREFLEGVSNPRFEKPFDNEALKRAVRALVG